MLKFFFACLIGCLVSVGSYAGEYAVTGKEKKPAVKTTGSKKQVRKKSTAKKPVSKKKTVVRKTTTKRVSKKSSELALDAFSRNKGKFIWPVEDGRIKTTFGMTAVPDTRVVFSNPGLTLEAAEGAAVKSIYDGVVKDLFQIEGKWGVTVQHGNYFSVYSNLSSVNIAKDDVISSGDILGTAASNASGNAELEFLMMKKNKNFDPEPWLVKVNK